MVEIPTYPSRVVQRACFFVTFSRRRFHPLLQDITTLFSLEARRGQKTKKYILFLRCDLIWNR